MDVAIVGPGRLGRSLDTLLRAQGVSVALCARGERVPAADVTLLTVPDGAIAAVAKELAPGRVVLHCAGSLGVEALRPHRPAGTLHPLMSFPGPEVSIPDLRGVGAAVSGDPEACQLAETLCAHLGLIPLTITGDRRLYHAAAVLAGNFATVLLADATRLLVAAGADPEHAASTLAPLALASIRGALPEPISGLTGPAARGDLVTIAAHREALSSGGFSALLRSYDALTERAKSLAGTIDETESV